MSAPAGAPPGSLKETGRRVPLILSSTPASSVADRGDAPRLDFMELAERLGGEVRYPLAGGGVIGRLEKATASDLRQALAARAASASCLFSFSEKVGLPLAFLARPGVPHILLAHHLTSGRKRAMQRAIGWLRRFDRVVVHCREQERYLREEAGLPAERVRFLYGGVDHRFYAPQGGSAGGYILSIGRERRDYETLIEAVGAMGVPTTIVASSPWSRQASGETRQVPENVTMRRGLSFPELRDLYDGADVVVVPLQPGTRYAAGLTGILEAMAMRRPVIVTDTPGIREYAEHGRNALVVPPADPAALRDAIETLRRDPALAASLAENARRTVEEDRTVDLLAFRLAEIVREVAA